MLDLTHVKQDIKASLVVFLVALPLSLGIALASGAPLFSGVLAGIIGGIVVGLVSNSKTSVSGPAAGLTIIVIGAIHTLGDFYIFSVAIFLAGVIQVLFGVLKAGRIGGYFPNSVIKGMLAAIGIILVLKQIPHAVGFDVDYMGDESFFQNDGENTFSEILNAFQSLNLSAVIISLLSLILLNVWEKIAKDKKNWFFTFVPSPLVVVLLGVFLNEVIIVQFFSSRLEGVHLVDLPVDGGVASFLNEIRFFDWSGFLNFAVYKVALTLAIVASLESMLSVEAVDKIDPHKNVTNKNRELVAQGFGNIIAGLLGALPVSSVIVRSSANIESGAMTKVSTLLHGFWLLIALIVFAQWLEMVPLASLAAILIHVGFKLSKPSLYTQTAKLGKDQFIPFVVTIAAILFTDLLNGIFIGIVTGFIFVIISGLQKSVVVVNEGPDYLIRFMKDVSFLDKPKVIHIFDQIPRGSSVTIDGSNHIYVDNDVIVIIQDFLEVAIERDIQCQIIKSTFAINPFFKDSNEIA